MITKKELLDLKLCIDNEYLDKYVKLINNNVSRKYEKHKTALHHIIPKYFYRDNNLEINERFDNKVNLLYTDHILAHYYLALCSFTKRYRFHNENALLKTTSRKDIKIITEDWIKLNAPLLNELYKDRGKLQSEYHKGKCFMTEKGKKLSSQKNKEIKKKNKYKYIHKGSEIHAVPERDVQGYVEQGWELGKTEEVNKKCGGRNKGSPWTDSQRKTCTEAKIGTIHIFKDNLDKLIKKELLEQYLAKGWQIGRSIRVKNKLKQGCKGVKKDHFKGQHQSEETKKNIGKANSGGKYINKDGVTKHIKMEELSDYLSNGWKLGSLNKIKKEKRCWVSNSFESKQILLKELEIYLKLGYIKGRKLIVL